MPCRRARGRGPLQAIGRPPPEQVLSTGFPARSGGRLLATPDSQGTCRSSAGSFRRIDFFVVSNGLAELYIGSPWVSPRRANPHLPVVAEFAGDLGSTFGSVFQGPSRLSSTPVFGPIYEADPPHGLSEAIRLAQLAVRAKDPPRLAEQTDCLHHLSCRRLGAMSRTPLGMTLVVQKELVNV